MTKLKTPFVLNHGGGSDDHLSKFLKDNAKDLTAIMKEDDPTERVMLALRSAIELERSKYPDFDDTKHYIHAEIRPMDNALQIFVQLRDKKI